MTSKIQPHKSFTNTIHKVRLLRNLKTNRKRVVNIPVEVEFNFTKKLEGRELKADEFSFVLKDKDGNILQTVKNDAAGNVKFAALEFKKVLTTTL